MKDALRYPSNYASRIAELALGVDRVIGFDLRRAYDLSVQELALIREAEAASGERLHKGHALHNIGVSLYLGAPADARLYFAAAHAEDIRLWPRRRPASWDFLAGRMLSSLYGVTNAALRRLESAARRAPLQDPLLTAATWEEAEPPSWEPLFVEALDDEYLESATKEDLVFVGGSYRFGPDRIGTIANAVRRASMAPVVVGQFRTREGERERTKSFRILDRCGLAVFDGTVEERPGWWPEIERITYQSEPIPTLVTFAADTPDRAYVTSSMFPSAADIPRLRLQPTGDPAHLGSVVEWWLKGERRHVLSMGGSTPFPTLSGGAGVLPTSSGHTKLLIGSNFPLDRLPMPSGVGPVPSGSDALAYMDPDEPPVGPGPGSAFVPTEPLGGWRLLRPRRVQQDEPSDEHTAQEEPERDDTADAHPENG